MNNSNKGKLVVSLILFGLGLTVCSYYYIFYVRVTPRTQKIFIVNPNNAIQPLPEIDTPDFGSDETNDSATPANAIN